MEIKGNRSDPAHGTVCPRSSDPFYIVSYYINWVTTSWTHSTSIEWYLITRCARVKEMRFFF